MSAGAEPASGRPATTGTGTRRALHVLSTFGNGGPQVRTAQLIARMGPPWQHEVLAMDGDTAAVGKLPAGGNWRLLDSPPKRSFVASVHAFLARLRGARPDLLLTYNWGSIEAVAAARWLGMEQHVHHEEGFLPDELQRRLWRRNAMRRLVLGRAHAVVLPSQRLHRIAQQEWRIPGHRALYLPNGVDCAHFVPAPAGGGTPGDAAGERPFTVGAIGGLRGEKDHATLVRAMAAMRQPARLLLVGDGPLRGPLRALADDLGLAARVTFAGAVADTAGHYRQIDAFALSSRTEQMPISLLEAMASGLPVASTDVGDVRIMLPEDSRGGLVPAGDVDGLARALDALAADPARRRREGAANRAHCERHYDLDRCLSRYVEVYERAAGGGDCCC